MNAPRQALFLIGLAATVAGLGSPGLLSASQTTVTCDAPLLIATLPTTNAQLGWSLSASGDWLAAGANQDSQNGANAGSVALYLNPQPGARPTVEIRPADLHAGDLFGSSVSMSGTWLAVGAPIGDGRVQDSGVVYVFQLKDGTWSQQARLDAGDAAQGAQFGFSVSLSGTTLVVGAPGDSGRGTSAGAAYVFELQSGTWNPTAKLFASDGRPFDKFGSAVATDGNEIVVGAPFADDLTVFKNFGAAYVFKRAGAGWTLEDHGKLAAADTIQGNNIQFGWSVAIRGNRILVGAPGADLGPTDSGAAYVFEREGPNWVRQPALTPEDPGQSEQFGTAVLIADADHVLIGTPFDGEGKDRPGAAYLFERQSDASWKPKFKFQHTPGGAFGQSVALLGDRVFLGGFQYDVPLAAGTVTDAGAVATCPLVPPHPCLTITKTHDQAAVCPGDQLTYEIAISNDQGLGPVIGATVIDDFPPSSQLQVMHWTCAASGGASCTPSSGSQVLQGVVDLPPGGEVQYHVEATVQASGTITNHFHVIPPPGVVDPTCNNDAMDIVDVPGDLGISVVGPSQVKAGDVATYSVVVTHSGAAMTGVRVKVDVTGGTPLTPADSRCFVNLQGGFTCSNFPAGFSSIPLELKVQAPGTCSCPADSITLTARVTANERECDDSNNTAIASTALACDADLALVVSDAPAAPVTCGDSFSFSLTASNLGTTVAKGAILDVIAVGALDLSAPGCNSVPGSPPHLTCSLPDLPGVSGHAITFSAQAPACGPGCGAVTINATVRSGNTCDLNPQNDMVTKLIPFACTPTADLAITKGHEPDILAPGQAMAYVLTVRNNGPSDVPGATVIDSLPNALLGPHCVGGNKLDCTFLGNNLNIAVGPLPVGGEAIYRIEGQLTCVSSLSNTATVSPPPGIVDPVPYNNTATDTTTVQSTSGVSIHCQGVSGAFEGDFVTFTYVLTNGGPNAQADNPGAEFTDTLPAGLSLVTATASSGTVTTAANTVSWNGSIPVCGTVTISVQAKVDPGTVGMTLCSPGTVFFDSDGDGINESSAGDSCCLMVMPPPPPGVPALSGAGIAALALLLACVALLRLRRRTL
ncbi:MAG: hypothetical protein WAM82_17675 [Thermoanaerobaculia bacterium]